METIACFFCLSMASLWPLLLYLVLQILIFCLYKRVFARNGVATRSYQGLLFLNVFVNIAFVTVGLLRNIGWNLGAILCVSMISSVVAMFESYAYYACVTKSMRDDK